MYGKSGYDYYGNENSESFVPFLFEDASNVEGSCAPYKAGGALLSPYTPRRAFCTDDSLQPHLPVPDSVGEGSVTFTREQSDIHGESDTVSCPQCDQTFSGRWRSTNCARHVRYKHASAGSAVYECLAANCGRVYRRQDARLKHMRKQHPEIRAEPVPRRRPEKEFNADDYPSIFVSPADSRMTDHHSNAISFPASSSHPDRESDSNLPEHVKHHGRDLTSHLLAENMDSLSYLWSPEEDAILIQARAQGLTWNQVSPKHFPHLSPNTLHTRHELLMERLLENRDPAKHDSFPTADPSPDTPDLLAISTPPIPAKLAAPEETATASSIEFDQVDPPDTTYRNNSEAAQIKLSSREVDWGTNTFSGYESYTASNSSSCFSHADSVLCTTSLATSATDLSKHSIYSADQIARATKELIIILQEDTDLATLYEYGLQSANIGPQRLERNLRRLFRGYADHLDKAAGDTIELHAARLVKMKARAVARSIVQKYDSDKIPQMKVAQMKMKQEQDQSSEEENNTIEVDERIFEDLVHFRDFLIRGDAFSTLYAQIQSFILPKPIRQEMSENNKGKGKVRDDRLDVDTLGEAPAPLRFEAPTNIDLWSNRAIIETLISEMPREIRLRGRSQSLKSLRDAQDCLPYIKPRRQSLTEHHRSTHLSAPPPSSLSASKHIVHTSTELRIDQVKKQVVAFLGVNEELLPLYTRAAATCAGVEELYRNLHRIFLEYAWLLDNIASTELESLVSLLVRKNARILVQSIIVKHSTEQMVTQLNTSGQTPEQHFDEAVDARVAIRGDYLDPVDVQGFLVRRDAFAILCARLRSLHHESERSGATGQDIDGAKAVDSVAIYHERDEFITPAVPKHRAMVERISKLFANILVPGKNVHQQMRAVAQDTMTAMGFMEPSLRPGFTRLRWQCHCGTSFHDDVREIREGGIIMLVEEMHRTGIKVVATSQSQDSTNRAFTFTIPDFARNATRKASAAFRRLTSSPSLPQYTTQAGAPATRSPASQQTLHMMTCTKTGQYGYQLYQDDVHDVSTDQELFKFMKKQLAQRRGYLLNFFSWTCLQEVYFRKFGSQFNYWGSSAEISVLGPSCPSSTPHTCDCIPPVPMVEPEPGAEYRCTPGPPKTCPPIASHQLMHWLDSPECISEGQTRVLRQLPKRICGELEAKLDEPVEGWGLLLKEGLNSRKVNGIVFSIVVISLIFVILWSWLKENIQEGFGVGQYIIAAALAIPAVLVLSRVGGGQ